jgi:transcriptional regulator with XRE-family HTH domain
MGIAQNMSARMSLLGITGYQIFKTTGISQSLISDYLSGKRRPSSKNLFLLAQVLGVSCEQLLAGEVDNKWDEIKKPALDKEDELKALLGNKKVRTVLDKLTRLSPANLDLALAQIDLLLKYQDNK